MTQTDALIVKATMPWNRKTENPDLGKSDQGQTVVFVPADFFRAFLRETFHSTNSPLDVWSAIWEPPSLGEPATEHLHKLIFQAHQQDARHIRQYFDLAIQNLREHRKDERR